MKTIKFFKAGYNVDIEFHDKRVVLSGDSGSGKTFLYDLLLKSQNPDLCMINYQTVKNPAAETMLIDYIQKSKDKIIVIDQADDVLRKCKQLTDVIELDLDNYYLFIGRSSIIPCFEKYITTVKIRDNTISLDYYVESLFL